MPSSNNAPNINNKELASQNIFAFDVKYSNHFNKCKDTNTQNDDVFFENLEILNFKGPRAFDIISNPYSDSVSSVKDDFFLNRDVLNLINSPTVNYCFNIRVVKHFLKDGSAVILFSFQLLRTIRIKKNALKNVRFKLIQEQPQRIHPSKLFVAIDENKSQCEDDKVINLSVNTSMISDISHSSKRENYPPKKDIILHSAPCKDKAKDESTKPSLLE
jgi:hypothetical protein